MASRDAARATAQPGSILIVVHDFKARSADELSLTKGDRIELIERDDDFNDGWFLGRHILSGITGLFPEVYTTVAPRSTVSSAVNGLRRTSGSMPNAVQAQEASSTMQRPASASTINTMQRPISGVSSYSKPSTATTRSSLPTSTDTKNLGLSNTQSPVMHETLTVIDEHMNDMNPTALRASNRRDTMSSMYSSHANRMSYIAGHETEDEEGQMYTTDEVMKWTTAQVAEYLEDHGVEKAHCQVFKEQEITGEVLLAMDQSSVFLKEFELGPVGRRLRTWHKIKALQDEAARNTTAGAVNVPTIAHELDANETARTRSTSTSAVTNTPKSVAPLRSSTTQSYSQPQSATSSAMSRSNSGTSPLLSAPRQDQAYRPSAQNIRTMQHWRHSSIESTATSLDGSLMQGGHRKQPSTDQSPLTGRAASHSYHVSTETTPYLNKEAIFASPTSASPNEVEKGYFSSTEAESRAKKNNVLQKKQTSSSTSHSRSGSFLGYRRSTRGASTDSLNDPVISPISSPSQQQSAFKKTGAPRTISMPTYGNKTMGAINESSPPIVTKLEPNLNYTPASTANASPMPGTSASNTPGTSALHLPFFSKTSKIPGMRAISDAVTRSEKSTANVPKDEVSSPTKDGVSTPSTGQASFDLKSGSRTSAGSAGAFTPQPTPRRPKTKTKKNTSAYTRGLESKSPAEQMIDCDYSGWMKKKSGSLMTTWKPRLFVLRGRRLSYYYSENDTEEKGLIDISFHNVMPAMDEKLTSMHAAMTGAGGPPSSPKDTLTTTSQQELLNNPPQPGTDDDALFIFKLTPPKSGRGVNFTKPTVHYFAVNSRQEGRLWMAALMKAVIDRDQDSVVTTTYSQKTISLAKARARKERPPALKDDDDAFVADNASSRQPDGLGIDGARSDGAPSTLGGADGGDRSVYTEDNSSIAASSIPTGAPSILTDLGDLEKDQLARLVQ